MWFGVAAWLSLPAWRWHIGVFESAGPVLYTLLPWLATALAAGAALYLTIRRSGLWRWEPLLLAALLLIPPLVRAPRALLVALWIFAAAYAIGRRVLRWFDLKPTRRTETIALSALTGFGLLTCALFVLGLAGGASVWTFALLLGIPLASLFVDVRSLAVLLRDLFAEWRTSSELRSPLIGVSIFFGAIFLAVSLLVILTPSIAYDSIAAHLPLAKMFVEHHRLEAFPLLTYSYNPQGVEVLMALGYAFDGQTAAQMVGPIFFGLALLAAYGLAREMGAGRIGALAGVVFAATLPFLHWTGSVAKNDLALAAYLLGALAAYLRWQSTSNFRWIHLSVFLLAMSFGVKHVALFGAVPLGLLYLRAAWLQPKRVRAAVSLTALFLVFGVFWQVRTYILTGNPVYPFQTGRAVAIAGRKLGWGLRQRVQYYAQIPWQLTYGTGSFESQSPNPVGFCIVALLPACLLAPRSKGNAARRVCLFFVALYALYWASIWHILRYAVAAALILVLLIARCLAAAYESARPPLRILFLSAIVGCQALSLLIAIFLEVNRPEIEAFASRIDETQYLRSWLGPYAAMEYLKGHSSPGDRVISSGSCAALYAPDPSHFYCLHKGDSQLKPDLTGQYFSFLVTSETPPDLAPKLRTGAIRVFSNGRFAVYRYDPPKKGADVLLR